MEMPELVPIEESNNGMSSETASVAVSNLRIKNLRDLTDESDNVNNLRPFKCHLCTKCYPNKSILAVSLGTVDLT